MTPAAKAQFIKSTATELGFARVGITHVGPPERAAYYRAWLAAGHAGTMEYLKRSEALRTNPRGLLAGARAIICAAMSYRRAEKDSAGSAAVAERAADAARPTGRVAMYARGQDYHTVLHNVLRDLVRRMRAAFAEPFEARVCVDSVPVLERELAARAGLGWIGKNTLLMQEDVGSYLFLGEVVTTLDLPADEPVTDHCGTCTRCLDACPTQAFPAAYQLDASKCISYLTIEHRGAIPAQFHAAMGDWVFGCDVCQEVCPHNRRAPVGTNSALLEERTAARVDLLELLDLRGGGYRRLTKGTALRRVSVPVWRRNAAIARANQAGGEQSGAAPKSAGQ